MKKIYNLFVILALAFVSLNASAQLPPGSVAPDVTFTDIDGNEHRLYDYLDEGKTVVLDIFAVWCGPCWSYHQSGTLETVFNDNDNIQVFAIEGDPTTAASTITGGGNSIGNWTTGVDYPIADAADVADAFQIAYYPTIYAICPNRIVTEIGQESANAFANFADNCPVAVGFDNASIIDYSGSNFYCSDINPTVKVQNMGLSPLTSFNVLVTNNGVEVASTSWEGSLATYDIVEVSVGSIPANEGNNNIDVFVDAPNGNFDSDDSDNEVSVSVGPIEESITETTELTLDLTTDDYGSETSWELTLADGSIIASGEGYASNSDYSETITVEPSNCYVFNIYDSYGDGICCDYGNGSYSLTTASGEVVASGGAFGSGESRAFVNGTVEPPFYAPSVSVETTGDDVEGVVTLVNTTTEGTEEIISWEWDFGDGTFAFVQNPGTHEYTENGEYTITLTVMTTSGEEYSYTYNVIIDSITPIGVYAINGLKALNLFPNPADNEITISFSLDTNKEVSVNITNTLGQVVSKTVNVSKGNNTIEFNTSNLTAGLYFINFNADGEVMAKRFTVAR